MMRTGLNGFGASANMRECWNRQTGTFEGRVSTDVGVQVSSLAPSWSANFDDTASNAVSSRLSGLFQLGNFFIFPLMTNAVFTQRCGLEPRQSHFMRNLRCGKHTCRMKALRFSKNKYHKNLSAGALVSQNQRSGAFVISGGELMSK